MTADLKNEAQKALDAYDKYESHRDALQFAAAIESLRKAVELQAPAEAHDDGDELTAAYMAGAHDARKAHCLTTRQIEVLTFLAGEGTLDGHWFEPDRKPKFWWRTALREAFGADVSKAQPKGTEQTRSQRLAEAGYTRRLSWKSLPKDGDDETQKPIGIVGPAGGDEVEWRGNTIPPEGTRLYAEPIQAPAPAPETGDTNGRRDGLRSAVHGRVPVGGHTPGALADLLWASPDVMGLNAELGLTMDQLVQLTQAVLTAVPCAAVAHAPTAATLIIRVDGPTTTIDCEWRDSVRGLPPGVYPLHFSDVPGMGKAE